MKEIPTVPVSDGPLATAPRDAVSPVRRRSGALLPRLLVFTFLLLAALSAYAQTISVAPTGYVTVGLGGTLQYSATVTGLSSTDVTWSAGGVVGGKSVCGTISPTGLYTAPTTIPGQNPVQITATSKAKPSLSASVYVCILVAGPTLSSVTPNPLTTGSVTITLKGSGFKTGAQVMDTYNGTPIQLTTTSVTSDTIVASAYQGAAPSASFTVTNPSSMPSNAVVVPIAGSTEKHTLTVVNGTGGGSYAAGTVVTITANAPPAGQSFINWTGAAVASATATTTTLTMPSANTTVTANYTGGSITKYTLTVVSGSGGGSYSAGSTINITANTPPQGSQFANWTGATVANASASATTLTMPAANTTVTANYASVAVNIPFPVTTHPRLWVTQGDLPRLRSWAISSNPAYAQGMLPLLNQAIQVYTHNFFPNGVQNATWPDPGDTQGYQGNLTEQYAFIFAFNSLIDPVAANRIKYAQYARNLIMVAMNQAVLGNQANTPFRDPMFAVYNRANANSMEWPLVVDWIYSATDAQSNPILTAADKDTIRKVFLNWGAACVNASTAGGDHPFPMGATNTLQLLPGGANAYRMASNNYYLGHARLVTMMGLCFDPSDDPAVNPALPLSQMGNSVRSYILNGNGAWLYQLYAMMGEPANVASEYGIPGNGSGLGLASGGLPPEGMLYGHSFGYILGQLLALQTAGFNSVANSGPQIHLIGAPVWDRFVTGYFSSMLPKAVVPPTETYLGPTYGIASYGDLLRLYVTEDGMNPFALLALLEQAQGQQTHSAAARWFAVNAAPGGAANWLTNISQPFTWGVDEPILYYLLMDPAMGSSQPDPRPTFPLNFYDKGAARIIAHSDWGNNGTIFTYRASWESINHQDGDGGQFEFFRNGEWLTKEMSNYDNNAVGMTTYYHNTLALQNWSANGTPSLSWFEGGEWANGSQWILGANAGDPTTVTSNGAGYTYAASDLTNLYNRPNVWTPAAAATDIKQATRSILWLNNDYIVVYDRATSTHSGLFKQFNLNFINNPVINGSVATTTTPSGQKLFVQSLLPLNGSLSSTYTASNLSPIAELEPTRYTFTVQDASNPTDTRFLHVLQGANSGVSMVPATLLSSQGTAFDGACFGSTAVFFPKNATFSLSSTTFTLPAGVHTLYVAGLGASSSYSVTVSGGTITLAQGTGATTDSAGLLKISF